ncbi:FabG [Pyrenophora teres f. teres]|nr:hypothetical protein PTNB29_07742 [Pyrenophora teres f. teres]CAE7205668.1 FabG [Pyrenophora teres f. teres]
MSTTNMKDDAILITGASSGLGLAFLQHYVSLPSHPPIIALDVQPLPPEIHYVNVQFHRIDITCSTAIQTFAQSYESTPIKLVIHCAGIRGLVPSVVAEEKETGQNVAATESMQAMDHNNMMRTFEVNTWGTFNMIRSFLPNLLMSYKRVVDTELPAYLLGTSSSISMPKVIVLSSRMGSITANKAGGGYAYRASKAALNAVVKSFVLDVPQVQFLMLHPGRVETRLVEWKEEGAVSVEESVRDCLEVLGRLDEWTDESGRKVSGKLVDRFGVDIPCGSGGVAESTRAAKVLQLPNCEQSIVLTAFPQRRDTVQYTAMSSSPNSEEAIQRITPLFSFMGPLLTPPHTNERPFTQAPRVIALFQEIRAGQHFDCQPWIEFLLVPGEVDEVQRLLERDEDLLGFVEDKIRYDYDLERHLFVVRMPTPVHGLFIGGVEDAILSRLKSIREGSGNTATFAQKVQPLRSTQICFPTESNPSTEISWHEPDASYAHEDAKYPGVIIEVSYSQKRKRLDRLAEDYLLDSNASVQAVVGLDIEYGKKGSCKATLTVWRAQVFHASTGDELRVEKEVEDEVFRDDLGNATDSLGLQLHLRDFACKELVQAQLGSEDEEIHISSQQLCKSLEAAERRVQQLQSGSLIQTFLSPNIKKRRRSETPPEEIGPEDETQYNQQEWNVAKRLKEKDWDYKDG